MNQGGQFNIPQQPSGGAYWLSWVDAQGVRRSVQIRGSILIGRSAQCNLSFPQDSTMSQQHARISIGAQGVDIQDMNSTNGVIVNQHRVRSAWLRPGDSIQMGRQTFHLMMSPAPARPAAPQSYAGAPQQARIMGNPAVDRPQINQLPPNLPSQPLGVGGALSAEAASLQSLFTWWWVLLLVAVLSCIPLFIGLLFPLAALLLIPFVFVISMLSATAFGVISYILLYKFWSVVQDGYAPTTPGNAVGFCFIPFYNLYWIFIAFGILLPTMAACLERKGIRGSIPNPQIGMVFCILTLCTPLLILVPFLGLVPAVAAVVCYFLLYTSCKNAAMLILQN